MEKKKFNKKKLIQGAATVTVLASLVAGMLFSGATEITPEMTQTQVNPAPIVMDIDEFANATVDDDDEDQAEQKKGGVKRLLIAPLSLIGTALMTVASLLFRLLIASPIGAFALTALVSWGLLVGVYAGTAKLLFPDVPMSKILSKGHIATLGVVALVIAGIDAAAPLFWDKYPLMSGLVKLGIGAAAIAALLARVNKLRAKIGLAS
ncbi:MAG: hypothetical protein KBS56_02890 [Clostridiales bacterium]|nr:hypothetical protein [Candidatus Crickella equi]